MASIFEKIRTITLGNVHALLDKVEDLNNPASLKQSIRDIETAIEQLKNSRASSVGQKTTQEQMIAKIDKNIAEAENNINLILGDGDDSNDGEATTHATKIEGWESEKAVIQETLDGYLADIAKYDQVIAQLQGIKSERLMSLRNIERMDQSAKAVEKGAAAIEMAKKFIGEGQDASVDSMARKIMDKKNIADAKLAAAMEGIQPKEGQSLLLIKANKRIADMKAKLVAGK